ncbi:MAG TPA: replication factor C small subunit [Nitrososphaerales archaeon]|nr:replication factor C small subunit [Nitrososphaerales archaeon]
MPLESLMWVEKYRPHRLDDIVNQEEVKERIRPLLEKKEEMPHLLFAGPPGSGKTTAALIVAREVLGDLAPDYTLSLNASDERGIDIVRERIKTFASYTDRREGVPFRLVILDEADEMTHDAMTALRRIMEETSRYTRFILVCNYSSNIIEPIQSRCAIFRFKRIGQEEAVACLKRIAKAEDVKASPEVLKEIAFAVDGDLRQAINLLQAASGSGSGEVTVAKVNAVTGATAKEKSVEVIRLAMGGDFQAARLKLVELTRVYGIPESDFLRFANEEIAKNAGDKSAEATGILAEFDYRLAVGSNPEVQLTALLAALAALDKKGGKKPA